jgi:hypothetical protein
LVKKPDIWEQARSSSSRKRLLRDVHGKQWLVAGNPWRML